MGAGGILWQDENAIWRNPTNRKWFGALLRVKGTRIGLAEDEVVEVWICVSRRGWRLQGVCGVAWGRGLWSG